MYQADGDGWVVIASNAGRAKHPGWWLNLRAHPEASVQIGRESHPVVAHRATGAERDRLWQKMVDAYAGYDAYRAKTTRQLPVVKLERR